MAGELTRFDGWVGDLMPAYNQFVNKMFDFDHGFCHLVRSGLFSFAYKIDLLLADPRIRTSNRSFVGGNDAIDQRDLVRIRALLARLSKRHSDKFLTALRILALESARTHMLMADERISMGLHWAEMQLNSLGRYENVDDDAAALIVQKAAWQGLTGPYAASELWAEHKRGEASRRQRRPQTRQTRPQPMPLTPADLIAARSPTADRPESVPPTRTLRNTTVWLDLERQSHNFSDAYMVELRFDPADPGRVRSAAILYKKS